MTCSFLLPHECRWSHPCDRRLFLSPRSPLLGLVSPQIRLRRRIDATALQLERWMVGAVLCHNPSKSLRHAKIFVRRKDSDVRRRTATPGRGHPRRLFDPPKRIRLRADAGAMGWVAAAPRRANLWTLWIAGCAARRDGRAPAAESGFASAPSVDAIGGEKTADIPR